MKKVMLREALLLSAPLLLLMGVGFMAGNNNTRLVIEKAEVIPLAPPKQIGDPDTKVNIVVKYNAGSLYQRLTQHPHWDFRQGQWGAHLEDESGKRYTNFKGRNTVMHGLNHGDVDYIGQGRYSVAFLLPLSQVPRSAGNVTLKAFITVDSNLATGKGGFKLPISALVRS